MRREKFLRVRFSESEIEEIKNAAVGNFSDWLRTTLLALARSGLEIEPAQPALLDPGPVKKKASPGCTCQNRSAIMRQTDCHYDGCPTLKTKGKA